MTPPPGAPRFVTLPGIRRAARQRLPRAVWNFGAGGAETETTLRRNRRHLDRLAIQQNVLVDVREIDLRASLLGVPLSWPVAVAPMGGLVLFHPDGAAGVARALEILRKEVRTTMGLCGRTTIASPHARPDLPDRLRRSCP